MDSPSQPRPVAPLRLIAITAGAALALLAAACGSGDTTTPNPSPSPAVAPTATTGAVSITAAPPASTTPTAPPPDTTASSGDTPTPPTPTITVPPDRERVPAPIDNAEIIIRESAPPQYAVHIVSGLPNGCTQFAGITTSRTAATITITVENSMPRDKTIACTLIYGTHEATVELGSDFTPGTTYTVHINDRTLPLTPQ